MTSSRAAPKAIRISSKSSVAMLIDDGVIVTSGDRWRMAADRLVDVPIPSTLAGVLQARLDGLPPCGETSAPAGERDRTRVLGRAAARCTSGDDRSARGPATSRSDPRRKEPSSFEGVREYAFKHHLLHQVTYDGVLRGDKRQQHRLTAEWLVARSGERSGQLYGVIADHYEARGGLRERGRLLAQGGRRGGRRPCDRRGA
jgi:hypothetical protein